MFLSFSVKFHPIVFCLGYSPSHFRIYPGKSHQWLNCSCLPWAIATSLLTVPGKSSLSSSHTTLLMALFWGLPHCAPSLVPSVHPLSTSLILSLFVHWKFIKLNSTVYCLKYVNYLNVYVIHVFPQLINNLRSVPM